MSRPLTNTQSRRRPILLRFDPLEGRPLLSGTGILQIGSSLSVVEPITLSQITVTFSPAIDPSWLDPTMVDLIHVQDGLPGDSVFWNTPPESFDFDPSGSSLTITLSGPLDPGSYSVLFVGQPGMTLADGTPVDDPEAIITVTTFDVADGRSASPTGPTLDGAAILPVEPASDVQSFDDQLDPGQAEHAVRLYRIVVPGGQSWRFGVDLESTLNIGDTPLVPTLLDANGNPVSLVRLGTPGVSPHVGFFAGLGPGTYYLAVSANANPPRSALSGGFDATTGDPGLLIPGGGLQDFRISFVAEAVVEPTRVIDFRLDAGDPSDSTPSGFTLQFSTAVLIEAGVDPITAELGQGVEVVGADGQIYLPTAYSTDPMNGLIHFLFPARLAPGSYTIRASGTGKLVDLAGQFPTAAGLPSGVLARFDVAETGDDPVASPGNLGTIYAQPAPAITVTVDPAAETTIRFVIAAPGDYNIAAMADMAGVILTLEGPNGTTILDGGPAGLLSNHSLPGLAPGVYSLRISSPDGPAQVMVAVRANQLDADSIARNVIGSGSTLDLRLAAPVVPTPPPGTGQPTPQPPVTAPNGPGLGTPTPPVVVVPELPSPTPTVPPGGTPDSVGNLPDKNSVITPRVIDAKPGTVSTPNATGGPVAGPFITTTTSTNQVDDSHPSPPSVSTTVAARSSAGLAIPLGNALIGAPNDPNASRSPSRAGAFDASRTLVAANQGFDRNRPVYQSPGEDLLQSPDGSSTARSRPSARLARQAVIASRAKGKARSPVGPLDNPIKTPGDGRTDEVPNEAGDEADPAGLMAEANAEEAEEASTTPQLAGLAEPAGLALLFAVMARNGRRLVRRGDRQGRSSQRSRLLSSINRLFGGSGRA